MTKIKTLVILLLISGISFAQTKPVLSLSTPLKTGLVEVEELKESALRDAKITSNATLKINFETVLKYTYPSVVDMMGGKEKALELIKTIFSNMKDQGFVFEKAEIISVSDIVFEQDEYRCYVEGLNEMTMPEMRIKSKSFLLGIYSEEMKIWQFIEAKQLKNPTLADKVLPDFTTSLEIPDDEMTTEQL